jgi:hypothetical protein
MENHAAKAMKAIRTAILFVVALASCRAQYLVTDITGNSALSAIKGLSSEQLGILKKILAENQSQLQSLLAIQRAIDGSGSAGGGGALGIASTFTGGASQLTGGSGPSTSLPSAQSIPGGTTDPVPGGTTNPVPGGTTGSVDPSAPAPSALNNLINSVNVDSGGLRYGNGVNLSVGGAYISGLGGQNGTSSSVDGIGNGTVGNLSDAVRNPGNLSISRISGILANTPGMNGFNLQSMFPSNNFMDLFMGMSPTEFKQAIQEPTTLLNNSLMGRVLGAAGISIDGKISDATNFLLNRFKSMTTAERVRNADTISRDLATIKTAEVVQDGVDARQRGQVFSAATKDLSDQNDKAPTLMEKLAISNKQTALQAQITIDANARAANAASATAQQSAEQTRILESKQVRDQVRDSIGAPPEN